MSLLVYNFESEYLNINHEVLVVLPDKNRGISPKEFYGSGKKYKVLWLLHGTYGDPSDWIRKTNIELYAAERDLAVVIPPAQNSNYSNWPNAMLGFNMYDYLTKELMPLVYGWLPISDKREDNFIAGLSMGGRGAIKYAVNHPDLFGAAAILSAVPMDFSKLSAGNPNPLLDLDNPRLKLTIENAGGLDAYIHSEENVYKKLDLLANTHTLPKLLFACGEEDAILAKSFLELKEHFKDSSLDAQWLFVPGYKHEWRFWDYAIEKALDFFELEKKEEWSPF